MNRTEQLAALDDATLKSEAKRLYDYIYVKQSGARSDVEEFQAIALELETRGFKVKRLHTIYFVGINCKSCKQ